MSDLPKKWTVMVYLAGDNNLDTAGLVDLKEMKKVGSTQDISLIAEFDNGADHITRRYFLTRGGKLDKDVLPPSLGKTNTGDPKVLEDFLNWGIKKYPADHYMVVLWNHGNGWDDQNIFRTATDMSVRVHRRGVNLTSGPGQLVSMRRLRVIGDKGFRRSLFKSTIEKAIARRGIGYDYNARDFLDNIELKGIFTTISSTLNRKIDIVGMDACLMSMVEVIYQIRNGVGITVASEQTEPGDGWPYDTLLGKLKTNPEMKPKDLAVTAVEKYIASYKSVDQVTQAACSTSNFGVLTEAIDDLGKTLTAKMQDADLCNAITLSRLRAQSYETADYVDVCDYAELLRDLTTDNAVQMNCLAVMNAVRNSGCVLSSRYKGTDVEHSHGVSVYFPQKKVSSLYATLDFAKDTSWGEFLESYVSRVSRPRRTVRS